MCEDAEGLSVLCSSTGSCGRSGGAGMPGISASMGTVSSLPPRGCPGLAAGQRQQRPRRNPQGTAAGLVTVRPGAVCVERQLLSAGPDPDPDVPSANRALARAAARIGCVARVRAERWRGCQGKVQRGQESLLCGDGLIFTCHFPVPRG